LAPDFVKQASNVTISPVEKLPGGISIDFILVIVEAVVPVTD
jgi:hypothetical protein